MSCLFCKIASKEIPSKIIYEDNDVFAFEDINPQAPLHTLIVPKKHIATLLEITTEDHTLVGKMFQTANQIAKDKGVDERGFRTVMNCNHEAGQSVYHLHLHLLAGRPMRWPPG